MYAARAAELRGERLPLDSGAQDVEDAGERLPGGHGFPSAARLAYVLPAFLALALGDERFHEVPEFVRQFPGMFFRHGAPRFFFRKI